jgi:hypothetical protein
MVRSKFLCIEKGETGHQPCQTTAKVILQPVAGTTEERTSHCGSGHLQVVLSSKF